MTRLLTTLGFAGLLGIAAVAAQSPAEVEKHIAAAEQFLLRLLPQDRAQVGAFSDKIQFSGEFTNNRDDLIFALRDLQFGKTECRTQDGHGFLLRL